ncbi:MAG: hypothetical protein ACYDEQ_08010 [Desulfocucumaceae bacterium]
MLHQPFPDLLSISYPGAISIDRFISQYFYFKYNIDDIFDPFVTDAQSMDLESRSRLGGQVPLIGRDDREITKQEGL